MNVESILPELRQLPILVNKNPEQLSRLTHMLRLRLITRQFLALEDRDVAKILETIGDLKKRQGKLYLAPCVISKSRFANWLAGKPPMALWRLGAAVASLEFVALEKVALYMAHDLDDDDPRVKSLAIAIHELRKFRTDTELNRWVWEFRWRIFRRLELDAKRDKTAGIQLSRYSSLLAEIQIEEKEDVKGSGT